MTYFVILIVGSTTPEEKVILTALWLKSIFIQTFLYFETFWSLEIVEKRAVNNKSTTDFRLVSTFKAKLHLLWPIWKIR